MMEISKVQNGRQLPHLDEQIWQKILQDFTLTEWARAAGVCKTTWSLQMDQIRVDRKLDLEGLPLNSPKEVRVHERKPRSEVDWHWFPFWAGQSHQGLPSM